MVLTPVSVPCLMPTAIFLSPLQNHRPEIQAHNQTLRRALGPQARVFDGLDTQEALDKAAAEVVADPTLDTIAISGADAGFGAGMTSLLGAGLKPGRRLAPLGGPGLNLLANELGLAERGEDLAAELTGAKRGFLKRPVASKTVQWRTLRLTDSSKPRPLYGFTFGAGAIYTALEGASKRGAQPRRGLRAALRTVTQGLFDGQSWQPVAHRLTVDGQPYPDTMRMLAASVLPALPLGLRPFAGVVKAEHKELHVMWHNMSAAATAALAIPLSRGRIRNPEHRLLDAKRLCLDFEGGYVLDGELHPWTAARVLAIRTGPTVNLSLGRP